MFKAEGIIPAMITPFDSMERINEEAIRTMVNRFISAGVHGLFCLGTNGEFFSLSYDEKIRIAEIVIEESAGRLPVYAGAGCTSTAETIRLSKRLASAGADALSIITPYFLNYTQRELLYHYESIADAMSLPIVLYNIPARTGNALQPKTVAKLAEITVLIGPHDLSVSLGVPEQYRHPIFVEAVETIISKARAAGVAAGIHYFFGVDQEIEWAKAGLNLLVHASDMTAFMARMSDEIAEIKQAVGDPVRELQNRINI